MTDLSFVVMAMLIAVMAVIAVGVGIAAVALSWGLL